MNFVYTFSKEKSILYIFTIKRENLTYLKINRKICQKVQPVILPNESLVESFCGSSLQMNLENENQKPIKNNHMSSFKELRVHRYDPNSYFYFASYSYDTYINNESLRNLLFTINNNQIKQQKSSMNFLKLRPTKEAV